MKLKMHLKNMKRAMKLQKKIATLGVGISFSISKGVESLQIHENRIVAVKQGKSGFGLNLDFNKTDEALISQIKKYIKPTFEKVSYIRVLVGGHYYYKQKGAFVKVKVLSTNIGSYTIEINGEYKNIKKQKLYDTPDDLNLLIL